MIASSGALAMATLRTQWMRSTKPVSCAKIMTFRTKGERGDQCSFIMMHTTPGRGGSRILIVQLYDLYDQGARPLVNISFQRHVQPNHVPAIDAVRDHYQIAVFVDYGALYKGDSRIKRHLQERRGRNVGKPDGQGLA